MIRKAAMTVQSSTCKSAFPAWPVYFAWTGCLAMLLLIFMGGLVTGFRAGMAVPDWPGTFGYNMFLYPLQKMTGGIFYEHSHRLLGSLVGLTTLTLAILLTVRRRPLGALLLIWIVGVGVAVQGIMGGLRVTENNVDLAVVHGFFAHMVLAGMVAVAALLSRRQAQLPDQPTCNTTDCLLSTLLLAGILLQTLLGTLVRQKDVCLLEHISLAMFVIILAIVVGVRLWGLYPHIRVFARGGVALIAVVIVQLLLGGISLAIRTPPAVQSPSAEQLQSHAPLQPALHAVITTLHQTTAAVLLGLATLLAVWCWRLMSVAAVEDERTEALAGPVAEVLQRGVGKRAGLPL
jgi:heme A synthase